MHLEKPSVRDYATKFNQIKGINITGYLHDQDLYRVDVVNNAECVYYVQEEDSSLIGINTSITSEMRVFLEDNKIQQIRFYFFLPEDSYKTQPSIFL